MTAHIKTPNSTESHTNKGDDVEIAMNWIELFWEYEQPVKQWANLYVKKRGNKYERTTCVWVCEWTNICLKWTIFTIFCYSKLFVMNTFYV